LENEQDRSLPVSESSDDEDDEISLDRFEKKVGKVTARGRKF
jgi:hypothetical protein